MTSFCKVIATALLAIGVTTPVAAATLNEWNLPGGAFSSSWSTPTPVSAGYTTITGTGSANVFDNFVFTGLPSGAQTMTITFDAPASRTWSYAAGGTMLLSTSPFRWSWDGMVQRSFGVFYATPSQTLVVTLGPTFSGALYFALNFTYGSNLAYTISAPANVGTVVPLPPATSPATTVVPVPAGGPMLAGLLGLLLFWRRRMAAARQAAAASAFA